MFGQLLAVTRNAFVESIRQPFYIIWTCVIGLGIVLAPYLAAYTFEDDNKLATDMSLSMLLMGGLILAAFTATGVISREIENRTALTVISKPIARPTFILGKFFGVAGALVLGWWNWSLLHLIALRQGAFSTAGTPWDFPVLIFGSLAVLGALGVAVGLNYLFHRHFGAAFAKWLGLLLPIAYAAILPFDHDFSPQSPLTDIDGGVLLASFFVLQAVFLFTAVAVACSTRLGQVATLVMCFVFFLLGITSDYIFGKGASEGVLTYEVLYAAVPNLHFLWLTDALTQGTIVAVDSAYLLRVSLYTLFLVIGLLGLAVALFQTRNAA